MRSFTRLLWLAMVAAAGVGAAICVAISDPPRAAKPQAVAPAEVAKAVPDDAGKAVVANDPPPNCRYLIAQPAPLVEVHSSPAADRYERESTAASAVGTLGWAVAGVD